MSSKFFYFILISSILASCGIINSEEKKTVLVVMCDVTRSLDTTSITAVTENAVQILQKFPDAEIFYYPIDSNLYVAPILKKESYGRKRYSERSELITNDEEKLKKGIRKIYEQRNVRASCVMKGFQIAYNKFKQYPEGNCDFKLIFLSDMLEHCRYSGGIVDLEKKENYEKSREVLKKFPKPEFDLAAMGVKPVFVITARQQLPIDEGLHKDFWREVCVLYGYTPEDFSEFDFGEGLPSGL
jgi:hypothetical protein